MLMNSRRWFDAALIVSAGVIIAAAFSVKAVAEVLKIDQRVRITLTDASPAVQIGYLAGWDNDTLWLRSGGEIRLDRIVTSDSSIFEFPYVGAVYSAESDGVSGTTRAGERVSVPLSEVDFADVTLLVKGKAYPMKFDRRAVQTRLRYYTVFPRLKLTEPVSSIEKIEVWHDSNPGGIVLFALGGAAAGLMMGLVSEDEEELFHELSGPTGAIMMGCLGGFIGHTIFRGRWTTVSVEELKVGVAPSLAGGIEVSCSASF